ncbi:MAG: XRE family transcriptional regulator [Sedimenticola sp.]|nr:MAG: XRE family transcriptional regulator [Sedimenticola sp.]
MVQKSKLLLTETDIGSRLKEERLRIGLSQPAFAEIGGVKKLTQIAYEQGRRSPDANYLAAVFKLGVDVCYVLSGERIARKAGYMDKEVIAIVARVIYQWLQSTKREITPQLLADVFTILYDGAVSELDEQHMIDQIRAVG